MSASSLESARMRPARRLLLLLLPLLLVLSPAGQQLGRAAELPGQANELEAYLELEAVLAVAGGQELACVQGALASELEALHAQARGAESSARAEQRQQLVGLLQQVLELHALAQRGEQRQVAQRCELLGARGQLVGRRAGVELEQLALLLARLWQRADEAHSERARAAPAQSDKCHSWYRALVNWLF